MQHSVDLAEIFFWVQQGMVAQLNIGGMFGHPTSQGNASELVWQNLFDRYLPKRYRAAPAFIIDSEGRCSRQIDLAIFDALDSPLLFPHDAGIHIPVECVAAVFEVKSSLSRQWMRDANRKAASVRALIPTSRRRRILSGLLASSCTWSPLTYKQNLKSALSTYPLDLTCCLEQGSSENCTVSTAEESLIFFTFRLLERLKTQGPTPIPNLMKYARHLESFK